jgi:predicted Zn-dependent peptidase
MRNTRSFGKLYQIPIALAIFLIIGFPASTAGAQSPAQAFMLDNGMRIILKENHASPMITSLIFVKAGSKFENDYNNGVTHFLEHLLFDGTATRSQKEISDGIEKLGGYINAFTRKEFTAYLVLMPRDYINYGMAAQADMLFNSVFPEDKFPKERKIVIEEMKKDIDAEGSAAEYFFEEKSMAGTSYARPIIGYESVIANIPRAAVIDYWKRFYGPNNMTALIIGDFESAKMAEQAKSIFGKFPKADLPPAPIIKAAPLSGKQIYKIASKSSSTYINYSIQAPSFSDPDYFAFALLEDYLNDEENSPLSKVLKSGAEPMASSVSASLDTKEEFSRLNVQIITEKKELADVIISATDSVLENIVSFLPSAELLNGYKISRRCNEIYMSEKLHYYGFTIAPLLAITGWDFFSKFQERIDSVELPELEIACRNHLSPIKYIATVVYPQSDEKEIIFSPTGPSERDIASYYEKTKFPEYDLSAGKKFKMPDAKGSFETRKKYASYRREVFDNGLTVVVKSNPDSRVFALNVLGRNRSALEPEGKDGITDFVNRMIEKGCGGRTAEGLAAELASIGANVTLYDNPWIPYDDRYTTRQYSFMKFETIDEFEEKGIALFSDMIANPNFDSAEVEKVRAEIMGLLGRNSGSTYKVARNQFFASLFEGNPYAKTIEGTFRTIGSITIDDLKAHHRRIYSPENMIIAVGTSSDPQKIIDLLKNTLGQQPKSGIVPVEVVRPANIVGIKESRQRMEKEQVYIYLGGLLPSAKSPDAAALDVAAAILSKRLQDNLREKEGLAYSIGASITLDKSFGWFLCSIGTSANNFEKARDDIIAEIEKLKTEMPTEEEVAAAINSIWGSNLTANLSRINQAYYMAVNEYLGLGYDYDEIYLDEIRRVDKGLVMKAARRYFDTKNYVISSAGKI